ncbi:MAG TPA: hypothetical protein VIS30_04860, partial [Candidatus Deferrimicrobiaceae bacterium]
MFSTGVPVGPVSGPDPKPPTVMNLPTTVPLLGGKYWISSMKNPTKLKGVKDVFPLLLLGLWIPPFIVPDGSYIGIRTMRGEYFQS